MGRVRNSILWFGVAVFLIGGSMLIHYRRILSNTVETSRLTSTETLLSQIEQALALYRADYDRYPDSLEALMGQGGRGRGPYFGSRVKGEVVDLWGRSLV